MKSFAMVAVLTGAAFVVSPLASMLDQDEAGPAQYVPIAGLDPGTVWEVGVRVARAINR